MALCGDSSAWSMPRALLTKFKRSNDAVDEGNGSADSRALNILAPIMLPFEDVKAVCFKGADCQGG